MSFLNRIRNFRSIFNSGRGITSMSEVYRNYDFFELKGFEGLPDITINLDSFPGLTDAYTRCSTISTIINRNSSALVNGKWWLVDKKDNDVLKKYEGIANLLKKPNPLQSWSEFITQLDVYRQLYGETFVFAVVPAGYTIQEASALWAINPNYISVELTGKMYMQSNLDDIIVNYFLETNGSRTQLDKACVLHIKDTNQNIFMSPCDVRGKSRMTGLGNSVRNIIQAEEAVYALNKNRGPQGILSNNSNDVVGLQPMSDKERNRLEFEFGQYGLGANQKKVILTDKDLSWQPMSFNVRDLMLFEGVENNIKRIAEAYNYPFELLNTTNIAYSNKVEAKREHYQGNIIPLSKIYAEKFTSFFGLTKAEFVIDYSEIECLKATESDKADMLYKQNQALRTAYEKGVVSTAEWRLAIGMDEEIYKPDNVQNNEEDDKTRENTEEEGEE